MIGKYLILLCALGASPLLAETPPPTYNRVSLSVSASEQVPNDQLSAILFAQQEGNDPADLARRVNQAVSQAVARAKQQSGIQVETLDYRTDPIYRDASITGWRVRQSVRLRGDDTTGLSQLIGELQQWLSVEHIGYDISSDQRRATEAALTATAIRHFRERAALISREMGHREYRLVQMDINSGGGSPPPRPMRTLAMSAESAPTLEAGSQRIELQISGTIELLTDKPVGKQ